MGSVAAWSAITGEENIIRDSRDHFYFKWKVFDDRIDKCKLFVNPYSLLILLFTDCTDD